MKELIKGFSGFINRMNDDHMAAYAAACAYFIILSFVPFLMVLIAVTKQADMDATAFMNMIIDVVPGGLKSFVQAVINEVYRKPYSIVPVSLLILVWSAAKAFHALTNGLNVISNVTETRGWLFLRVRSMFMVFLLLGAILGTLRLSLYGIRFQDMLTARYPTLMEIIDFLDPFTSLLAYFGLTILFLFLYKVLPNHYYTFRSQLPGALVVSTIWIFVSYMISIYYSQNANFLTTYGSLTGIILAMIWLYFCVFFMLAGAELNRIFYEDPMNNVIASSIDTYMERRAEKEKIIEERMTAERKEERRMREKAEEIPIRQPADIFIPWADEEDYESDIPWADEDEHEYERLTRP